MGALKDALAVFEAERQAKKNDGHIDATEAAEIAEKYFTVGHDLLGDVKAKLTPDRKAILLAILKEGVALLEAP